MFNNKRFETILGLLIIASLALAACQPQVIEVEKEVVVTQVVREEVEVEKVVEKEVEVEKIVEKEVEVEKIVEVEVWLGDFVDKVAIAFDTGQPLAAEETRKITEDLESLGFRVDLNGYSKSEMRTLSKSREYGNIIRWYNSARPQRLDPYEWVLKHGHSSEAGAESKGQNYGDFVCENYDILADTQQAELDKEVRQSLIAQSQELYHGNYSRNILGHPDRIDAYNSDAWDDVEHWPFNGAAGFQWPGQFGNIKPATDRTQVRIGRTSDAPRSLNYMNYAWFVEGYYVFDTLARMDADFNVIPWAAESWEYSGDNTWRLQIRDGMTFHDGTPVTAEDIAFSFNYTKEHGAAQLSFVWKVVDVAEVVDDLTVDVKLSSAFAPFETVILVSQPILSKQWWENLVAEQGGVAPGEAEVTHPIGSGQFKFGHYKKDVELSLLAHTEHFSPPYVDELLFLVIPSVDGLLGMLTTQELDFLDVALTPLQAESLGEFSHITVSQVPTFRVEYLVPLMTHNPFRDIEARRALAHAIDKDYIIKVVWQGAGVPGSNNSTFAPSHSAYNPNLPVIEYDLDKARSILADAGYTWDDDGLLHYPTDDAFSQRVEEMYVGCSG